MAKNELKQTRDSKRTGYGELIKDIERNKMMQQEFHDKMEEYIISLINTAKSNNSK
jgi:hypothetical protein